MHLWGDPDFSDEMFNQVQDAAWFIGRNLAKWGKIGVRDSKEKYGTVRVYCHFGFSSFYSLWRPQYLWVPKWWPYRLDLMIFRFIEPLVNLISFPIQKAVYRYFYQRAIKKWPEIKEEILCCANFPEYLKKL